MIEVLLIIIIILVVADLIVGLLKKVKVDAKPIVDSNNELFEKHRVVFEKIEKTIRDEFQVNRKEIIEMNKINRDELNSSIKSFESKFNDTNKNLNELIRQKFSDFSKYQNEINTQTTINVKEIGKSIINQQNAFNEQLTINNKLNREEIDKSLKSYESKSIENNNNLNELIRQKFDDFSKYQNEINTQTTTNVKDIKESVEKQLTDSRENLSASFNSFKNQFVDNIKSLNELIKEQFQEFNIQQNEFNQQLTEKNKNNREEIDNSLKSFESKTSDNNNNLNNMIRQKFDDFSKHQNEINSQTTNNVKDLRESVEKQLAESRENLSGSLITFKNQFTENIRDFNELIKEKFQDMKSQQNTFNNQISENSKNHNSVLNESLKTFEGKFTDNINNFNTILKDKFDDFSKHQSEFNKQTIDRVNDVKQTVDVQLKSIRDDNNTQLEAMRKTVDEKLQKTLNERLNQSFEIVNKQLLAVQEGIGEMKNLASDVGGLKKVLSNVKMRGSIGELQLEMLLEQILAPEQYEANVKTNKNSSEFVEFAVKLPGKEDTESVVWLPIDAKFPKDIYQQLIDAYDEGDSLVVNTAKKNMESAIKKMAKDISIKYIDPPHTTDFGIMYLPFEGIYAEVVRNASLLESLMREYKIIVTGPTTLAAILNSLQMGFKTLAIQKRSSEVWKVLSEVKQEFNKFGGMMEKAQKNIQTGLNQLDTVMGTRTRAIQRKLREVIELDEPIEKKVIPDLANVNMITASED